MTITITIDGTTRTVTDTMHQSALLELLKAFDIETSTITQHGECLQQIQLDAAADRYKLSMRLVPIPNQKKINA